MEWLTALEGVIVFVLGLIGRSIYVSVKSRITKTKKDTTDDITLVELRKDVKSLAEQVTKGFAAESAARKKVEKDLQEHKEQTTKNNSDLKDMLKDGLSDIRDYLHDHHVNQTDKTNEILSDIKVMLGKHQTEIDNLKSYH